MKKITDFWKPGNIVILDDDQCYYCITTDYAVGLNDAINLTDFNEETGKGKYRKSVKTIVMHREHHYGLGFAYNLILENAIEEVLWSNIVEYTVAELEQKLSLSSGTLRIKK